VVVAGPQRSLFDQEVKALSDYLNQGGSLLMIDPNTNPGMESLLKIGVLRSIIVWQSILLERV